MAYITVKDVILTFVKLIFFAICGALIGILL